MAAEPGSAGRPDGNAGLKPALSRRAFLRRAAAGVCAAGVLGGGYALLEAGWLSTDLRTLPFPMLPPAFEGLRVGFISDIHHGPYTGLGYVRSVVERMNALKPDVIVLGGDYVHREPAYIAPCFKELAALRAPLGVHGVLGNHDHWEGERETRAALGAAGIADLTNRGVFLERGTARLRLGGVGDLWEDAQDLSGTVAPLEAGERALLLSHNPDYVETLRDARVGLVLSGHTHGGQVRIPFYGAPVLPSRYGKKYESGWVRGPAAPVFVSRGAGTITPPVRFNCRPELHVLTLTRRA